MRKPQARESNEWKTTLEKNLLRVNLESLPEEKMHNNVRKRNRSAHLVRVEIDETRRDDMDVETSYTMGT